MKEAIRNQTRRFRAEWLALGLVCLIAGAALVEALTRYHASVEALEGDRLQVQAKVIDDNLIRELEGANKALEGIRDRSVSDLGRLRGSEKSADLRLMSDAMPGVSTMLIMDSDGTIVASSRDELVGRNFKERDYFRVPRRSPNRAVLYVSPPFKSSLDTFIIVVSRVLTNSKGEFAGVITATLDPDYFNVVLRSVLYALDMQTVLVHGDGKVFLVNPTDELAPGTNLAVPGSLFSRHQQSLQFSNLMTGKVLPGNGDRMVAMRSINRADLQIDRPLVVAVSRELSAIFRPWRETALQSGVTFALLALGSGLALYFSQRRRQAFGQIAAAVAMERQAGAERVELALRGADLGLWDLHVPSNKLIVNARERAMLGFSPDEDLPRDKGWRNLIHPDDRAAVYAAIQPHLRGETTTYECEHRMQHKDGHWIWIFNRAMIIERDSAGAPIRIVGTHLDVTERKRADAELERSAALLSNSEEQLRQVTDNMPALVSRLDLEQRFRFVNRAYRDWLHIEPASLLGRSLSEVYGEQVYSAFRHHVEAAMAGERVAYERELSTPDGIRQVEVVLVPQRGSDGSVQGLYTLMHDITARFEAESQRARSEERLNLALEGSGLALFDWDIGAGRIYQGAQAAAMRGEPAAETTTSPAEMQSFVHPDDLDTVLARLKDAVKGVTPLYHAEFRIRKNTGDWLWVRARGRVVERDRGGRALRLAGTYADINDRKVAEGRLRRLAEFDTLTDLPNRALFHDRLQQAMVRAARGKPMALLFLDIDHFKTVNDTLGHEAGDQLLKVFGRRMQDAVRQSDTVARLAGDEFTIILEGLNGLDDAQMLANKLVETLGEPIALAGKLLEITVSIGVAVCGSGELDDAALLRRADAALYEAKRRGRNGFFCDEDDPQNEPTRA